jgi:hypothetical protein
LLNESGILMRNMVVEPYEPLRLKHKFVIC